MVGIAILPQSTVCTPTFATFCKFFWLRLCPLHFHVLPMFQILENEKCGWINGRRIVSLILFYLGCFCKHFHSFPQSVLCTQGFSMLCTLEAETLWRSSAQLKQLGFRNSKRSFWRGNLLWAVPRSLRRSAILKPFQVSFCNNRFENVTANAMLQKISSLLLRQKFWLHLECNRFDNLLPGSLILYIHII